MSFRFRRTIKIAPGLRLNVGKRGVSMSAGVRGASMTFGRNGTYANVGLPGTGLSYRTRIDGGGGSGRGTTSSRAASAPSPGEVDISLDSDGKVEITHLSGAPLSPSELRTFKAQYGTVVDAWLEEQAEQMSGDAEGLLDLHRQTPPPLSHDRFSATPFPLPEPEPPVAREVSFMEGLLPGRRERVAEENRLAEQRHQQALADWRAQKHEHDRRNAVRRELFHGVRAGNPQAMEDTLEAVLQDIQWPRETFVSFDVQPSGAVLLLDVDLPEIEDLPTRQASVAARGWKLNIRDLSETAKRKTYMAHIHGIVFRLLGEAFHALPSLQNIALSAYSQRPDTATGRISDEYLLSVRVARRDWERIDFRNMDLLDPVAALERFDLKREMTASGIFRPVTPFTTA
jgi:hypothetical protein